MFVAQQPLPAPPAGGAAIGEVLIALLLSLGVMLPVGWFLVRERAGKPTVIGRAADWVASKDGLPRWAGLPSYLTITALLTAGFGVWWDVATHMQNGRDEGPLANPSHYPIFLAILAFFSAGIISMTLAKGELPRRSFRIAPGWHAPMGAMIITAAGTIALIGFPADDVWHRLFGQDVTEWGPTHIMMIGGAVTCVLGIPLLFAEARQLGYPGALGFAGKLRSAIALSTCIVPFAFLMEFDLGVPQFPAATQFIIAGFLIGWIFTAVRAYFGPGGALLAWGVYIGAHLFLMGTTALLDDVLLARFLLFLPSALLIELVALVVSPRRGFAFAVTSGVLVGTLGMLAEWQWSKVFMPLPQPLPASALPLMLAVATAAAIGGGLLAGWHVRMLARIGSRDGVSHETSFEGFESVLRRGRLGFAVAPGRALFGFWQRRQVALASPDEGGVLRKHGAGLAGALVFIALMAVFAPPTANDGLRGTVQLSDVTYSDGRQAEECNGDEKCLARVTVTMRPAAAADDAVWFYALAWQGRHANAEADLPRDPTSDAPGVMRVKLLPTGTPGEYVSEHKLPFYGNWKTLIRLHQAPTVHMALPLHAPNDPAIASAKGRQIVTGDGETVELITEHEFLQREIKDDVPSWLWAAAYGVVNTSWLVLIGFYGWCYAMAAYGAPNRRKRAASGSASGSTSDRTSSGGATRRATSGV